MEDMKTDLYHAAAAAAPVLDRLLYGLARLYELSPVLYRNDRDVTRLRLNVECLSVSISLAASFGSQEARTVMEYARDHYPDITHAPRLVWREEDLTVDRMRYCIERLEILVEKCSNIAYDVEMEWVLTA